MKNELRLKRRIYYSVLSRIEIKNSIASFFKRICATGFSFVSNRSIAFFTIVLFFCASISAQTTLVCDDGPVDDTFCYDDNNSTVLSYQSDGNFPILLTFTAGNVEDFFDELVVLDSDGVTNLNEATPYGVNDDGEIAGLTFISSGDTISWTVTSDGSISCASGSQTPIEFTVSCLTCTFPVATFETVVDCDTSSDFSIAVDITDLGSGDSVLITDSLGIANETVSETGVITLGPYTSGTAVSVSITNASDPLCTISSDMLVAFCIEEGGCEFGVDAMDDFIIDCFEACATISANAIAAPGVETTSYLVQGPLCDIPPVDGGTPTNLTIDDTWSNTIDLPFEFSFYNTTYSSIVVGANGQITFNTALANQFNDWSIQEDQLLPVTNDPLSFPLNTIYGAFHDLDPSVTGDADQINFFVIGDAPFRRFVLNFNQVPHFSCNDLSTTQQIVLYETLNVIDVNLINKPVCDSWNGGLASLGIQGNDETEFASPPMRNTGIWEAQNESWRFVPAGATTGNGGFEWQDEEGTVVGTDLEIEVCPTEVTTYTGIFTVDTPTGPLVLTDTVTVTPSVQFDVSLPETIVLCDTNEFVLAPDYENLTDATEFLWNTGATTPTITITEAGVYEVLVSEGDCMKAARVEASIFPPLSVALGNDFKSCPGVDQVLTATTSNTNVTYQWFLNGNLLADETGPTLSFTTSDDFAGQTYEVVISSGPCDARASVEVQSYGVDNCVISEGISPDSTPGQNDNLDLEFLADRSGIKLFKLFNRYGRRVYEAANYTNQWAGQDGAGNDLVTGTYYYTIEFEREDPEYGLQATGWVYINRLAD